MTDKDPDPSPGGSGSVDVSLSGTELPATASEPPPDVDAEPSRRKRAVTAVGTTIGKVGEAVDKIGEGVTKIGDATKVPLVGAGIAKVGEGMQAVGGSMHELAATAKTRRGRLLVRSMIVAFVMVAVWIVVIVMAQVRSTETIDFRPKAIEILTDLSNNKIEQVYDQASPRFQEIQRKERFVDDMTDLRATVGAFREISAVNDTLVTRGPTGRVGRVSLTLVYEKATCKASVSFHYDADAERWKLLGIGVELPAELAISEQQREERIAACKDPMNPKTCDVHAAAVAIFEKLRDGKAGEVWDAASPIFQKQEERTRFIALQDEHRERLGKFRRVIAVSEAKVIGGISATFDILLEYERSSGVRTVLTFSRTGHSAPWQLRSFKQVLPMPRAADVAAQALGLGPPLDTPTQGSAGSAGSGSSSGSGSAGSGSGKRPVAPKR